MFTLALTLFDLCMFFFSSMYISFFLFSTVRSGSRSIDTFGSRPHTSCDCASFIHDYERGSNLGTGPRKNCGKRDPCGIVEVGRWCVQTIVVCTTRSTRWIWGGWKGLVVCLTIQVPGTRTCRPVGYTCLYSTK